jgi:hypothetical protein
MQRSASYPENVEMGDFHNSGGDRSASLPSGAAGESRQTVLLGDLPDPEPRTAPDSNPTLRHINLSPDTLAALGVRYSTEAKARAKQKIDEQVLFPSNVVKKHSAKSDYFVLWIGPVKPSRGPIVVDALEAKGFSNAKETSPADYAKVAAK